VRGVTVQLGPLRLADRVLDGQFVQPELLIDHVEVADGGRHRSSHTTDPGSVRYSEMSATGKSRSRNVPSR
jgi:hypothetical protein